VTRATLPRTEKRCDEASSGMTSGATSLGMAACLEGCERGQGVGRKERAAADEACLAPVRCAGGGCAALCGEPSRAAAGTRPESSTARPAAGSARRASPKPEHEAWERTANVPSHQRREQKSLLSLRLGAHSGCLESTQFQFRVSQHRQD
jgi:hypothetical protein